MVGQGRGSTKSQNMWGQRPRSGSHTDAGFQSDLDDFRSKSGFMFCLNGGAVSWRSSKQDTVADSTTETEYIAASDAVKEVVFIQKNFCF